MPEYPRTPLNTRDTGYENRRIAAGKTAHVLAQRVEINRSVDEVWAKVSGNFVNGADIAESLIASLGLSGDLTESMDTERFLDINFKRKQFEA